MKVIDVLRSARELVRRGWTKYTFARDKYRHIVHVDSPRACRFCADGAIRRAAGVSSDAYALPSRHVYKRAIKALSGVVAGGVAPKFNDLPQTRKTDVVAAFDRAIEAARK